MTVASGRISHRHTLYDGRVAVPVSSGSGGGSGGSGVAGPASTDIAEDDSGHDDGAAGV